MAMIRSIRTAGASVAIAALCAPSLGAQAAPSPTPAAAARAAATITADDLRRRIGVIAHDSMRGRWTPSPELDQSAEWIASEFCRLGLRPGGDEGSYLQRYSIRTVVLDPENSGGRFGPADIRYGRDLGPALPILPPSGTLTGSLAVVSGTAAADGVLSRARLAGRHVLVVPASGADFQAPAVQAVVRAVLARGPLAVWIATDLGDVAWARGVNVELRREHAQVGDLPTLAAFVVRDASVGPALAGAGLDLAALRGRSGERVRVDEAASIRVALETSVRVVTETSAPNVVGILEGSDPALRDEYVVFSAHMDHVGVGMPDATDDSIYNGADDDASGIAIVVELAEAFAALEPRPSRSLIFLAVSGEEQGLWGSEYFTAHPPVPLGQMLADLNIDMVGRNWADTLVAIGREHSNLGGILDQVNAAHPELRMSVIDDPWPDETFFMRSDHYSFARRGVPVLFFFSGTHDDYHRPSDEVDKIDAAKTARIARLLFFLGLELAQRYERAKWHPDSYRAIVEGR